MHAWPKIFQYFFQFNYIGIYRLNVVLSNMSWSEFSIILHENALLI